MLAENHERVWNSCKDHPTLHGDLSNTTYSVKVSAFTSAPFEIVRGFRKGDALSCDLFNLIMEAVLKRAGVETKGTIFYKSVQVLAYTENPSENLLQNYNES